MVDRMRLRNGVRTVGFEADGLYKTEPTYGEYVRAEDYDALAARLAEAERLLRQWVENDGNRGVAHERKVLADSEAFLRGSANGTAPQGDGNG